MKNITNIEVALNFGTTSMPVGELAGEGSKIYFRFFPSFVKKQIQISPFKLPLNDVVNVADKQPFEGLFGVFADSLPDGWGRLLLDRALSAKGFIPEDITPLTRLALVGDRGMGALTYKPAIEKELEWSKQIDLDTLANSAKEVLDGSPGDVLEELYQLGGSSGGARPKILVAYNTKTNKIIHGSNHLPNGYEHWIIKFPSSLDLPDVANVEFAYNKMAQDAGIEMSECKLFTGKSGKVYFGTKRFDRIGNRRLHLHSAAGLLNDNFRQSQLDYGHMMDCAFQLEKDVRSYSKVLRLAAFNVMAHNRDDHSKNFSFLMDANGKWKTSPTYDLTFSSSGFGMHSTSVAGEYKSPGTKQLLELANHFRIKKPERIIEEVKEAMIKWNDIAKDCGVKKLTASKIKKAITIN